MTEATPPGKLRILLGMLDSKIMTLLQGIIDGLVGALVLAPVAAAFSLVFASTRVFYVAIGAIFATVPYIAASLMRLGLPFVAACGGAIVAGALMSMAMEYFNHRPLERRRSSELGHFIASLGAFTIVIQIIVLIWGAGPMALRADAHHTLSLGWLQLSTGQIRTGIAAIISLAAFYVWLPLSRTGLLLRALASNPTNAALCGLNVNSLRLVVFAISGMLCSAAALCSAWDLGFDPNSGMIPVLLAIVAATIGGRHSYWGPLVGILLVGLIRGIAVVVLSAQWQDSAAYLLLAIALVVRPEGILIPVKRAGSRQ
jgi:branched-chain amino acid transport system permease protein